MGTWEKRTSDGKPPVTSREVRNIPMLGFNSTQSGILTSKGFVTCWAALVYNEDTNITTGFHVYSPEYGFCQDQLEKLIQLGNEPGKKHAILMHGDYYKSMNVEQTEKMLSQQLHICVPGITLQKTQCVTHESYAHTDQDRPHWEFAYQADRGRLTITEWAGSLTGSSPDCATSFRDVFEGIVEGGSHVRPREKSDGANLCCGK